MESWQLDMENRKLIQLNNYIKAYDMADYILIEKIKQIKDKIAKINKQETLFKLKYNKYFDKLKLLDSSIKHIYTELYKSLERIYNTTDPYYYNNEKHNHLISVYCDEKCPANEKHMNNRYW